jgi:hypothetical protein
MKVFIGDKVFKIKLNEYCNDIGIDNFYIRCWRNYGKHAYTILVIEHYQYWEFYKKHFSQKDKSITVDIEELVKKFNESAIRHKNDCGYPILGLSELKPLISEKYHIFL